MFFLYVKLLPIYCVTFCTAQETVDLVTFTEEILNGKLLFLCCVATSLIAKPLYLDNFSLKYDNYQGKTPYEIKQLNRLKKHIIL